MSKVRIDFVGIFLILDCVHHPVNAIRNDGFEAGSFALLGCIQAKKIFFAIIDQLSVV
jgi:hypothetical protein